mgnify:CR=1 FL=1
MLSLSRAAAVIVVQLTLLAAMPAAGHHGWSGNAGAITVTGELVTALSLAGPHGTMQVWDITLAPAPRTHRAGLREDTIPTGAQVTVEGERNADAARHEIKVRRVTHGDRHYDVYPPPRG